MELIRIDNDFKDKNLLYAINDEAFPDEERIPSGQLLSSFQHFGCDAWAVYDNGRMSGFTVIMADDPLRIAYIWFLAIDAKLRSHGYGSKTLKKLAEIYGDYQLVLDLERPDKSSANSEERLRRISFYEKNGYLRTGYGMSYFGVDYEVMFSGESFRREDFQKLLDNIKFPGFHPVLYEL